VYERGRFKREGEMPGLILGIDHGSTRRSGICVCLCMRGSGS
jgi:hypothetical protein